MRDLVSKIVHWCAEKVRAGKVVTYTAGALIVVLLWIFSPYIFDKPYYRIEGSNLTVKLDSIPTELDFKILFVHPPSELELANLLLRFDASKNKDDQRLNIKVDSRQDSSPTVVALNVQLENGLKEKLSILNPDEYFISLYFGRRPFLDIREIKIGDELHTAQSLDEIVADTPGKLMEIVLVREIIADKVLKYNDSVGNIFLALLAVVALWLFGRVGSAAIDSARYNKRKILLDCKIQNGGTFDGLWDALLSAYWERERALNFWKIVGPSTGFLLTVSSLAAALHPNIQSDQGAYTFFSSVQVAIISTFIGLAIRLFAQFELTIVQATLRSDHGILRDKFDGKGT